MECTRRLHDDEEAAADLGAGHRDWRGGGVRGTGAASADWAFHQHILFWQVEHGAGFADEQSSGDLQRAGTDWGRADYWSNGAVRIGANPGPWNSGGDRGDSHQWKPG